MSRLVARILLALFMLPLAGLVSLIIGLAVAHLFQPRSEIPVLFVAGSVGAMFAGVYWVLLWRGTVKWTQARIAGTALAAAGCMVIGSVLGTVVGEATHPAPGLLLGGGTATLLWLTATVLIWRETSAERLARLRGSGAEIVICPACGYNLTGLKQTTCPECGASYTINELIAGQPGRETDQLENI